MNRAEPKTVAATEIKKFLKLKPKLILTRALSAKKAMKRLVSLL